MKKYEGVFLTTTDTIAGIGAPVSKENFEKIYDLKKRDKNKPLIIMVHSIAEARKLQGWSEKAEKYAKKYWPGQTTLVLTDSVAVRIPDQSGFLNLLSKKGPCYVTSANLSGDPTYSLSKAQKIFPQITEVYDFGPGKGIPSKIIDVRTERILR